MCQNLQKNNLLKNRKCIARGYRIANCGATNIGRNRIETKNWIMIKLKISSKWEIFIILNLFLK